MEARPDADKRGTCFFEVCMCVCVCVCVWVLVGGRQARTNSLFCVPFARGRPILGSAWFVENTLLGGLTNKREHLNSRRPFADAPIECSQASKQKQPTKQPNNDPTT